MSRTSSRRRPLLPLRRFIHRAGLAWAVFPATVLLTLAVAYPALRYGQTHTGAASTVAYALGAVVALATFCCGVILDEATANLQPRAADRGARGVREPSGTRRQPEAAPEAAPSV